MGIRTVLRRIFKRSKCTYHGCTSSVYTDGLCYKHFSEKVNKELASKPEEIDMSLNIKGKIHNLFYYLRVFSLAVIWILTIVSAGLFAVYCYRVGGVRFWMICITAFFISVVGYLLVWLIMKLTDKYNILSVIYIILIVAAVWYTVLQGGQLADRYSTFLKYIARQFAEFFKNVI